MAESGNGGRAFPLRINLWWRFIVPPVFAFAYLGLGREAQEPLVTAVWLALFAVSVLGTAGFGYLLNDWTDIRQDAAAGKPNQAAGLSFPLRWMVAASLLALAWLPWLWLPANSTNLSLLAGQFLVFLLYSLPPVRLKEKGLPGILCDMLYGHVLPALIAISTFFPPDHKDFWMMALAAVMLTAPMGLRNILLHQIEDRKADRLAGAGTFVLRFGPRHSLNLVKKLLIPLEMVCIPLALKILGGDGYWLLLLYGTFMAFSFFSLSMVHFIRWGGTRSERHLLLVFFLNDFYEGWLPLGACALLYLQDPWYLVLVLGHLLLFPGILTNLSRDLKRMLSSGKK